VEGNDAASQEDCLPTDFSAASRRPQRGLELIRQFPAELVLVHVLPVLPPHLPIRTSSFSVPEYERALHADAEQRLTALASDLTGRGVAVRTVVGHGDAGAEIVARRQ